MSNEKEKLIHRLCDIKIIAIVIDHTCGTVNVQFNGNAFTPHDLHAIVTMLRKNSHDLCKQSGYRQENSNSKNNGL